MEREAGGPGVWGSRGCGNWEIVAVQGATVHAGKSNVLKTECAKNRMRVLQGAKVHAGAAGHVVVHQAAQRVAVGPVYF